MIYLDNNGTTLITDEVRAEIARVLWEPLGNPASNNALSKHAAALLADARQSTAELVGADPDNLIFTSSGSESNVTVIRAATRLVNRSAIVVSAIEHASISTFLPYLEEQGMEVRVVPVLSSGIVDIEQFMVDPENWTTRLDCVGMGIGGFAPWDDDEQHGTKRPSSRSQWRPTRLTAA